jgi:hypothetical protein
LQQGCSKRRGWKQVYRAAQVLDDNMAVSAGSAEDHSHVDLALRTIDCRRWEHGESVREVKANETCTIQLRAK